MRAYLVSVADGSILLYATWKYVDDGNVNAETIVEPVHLARKCKPIVRVTIILGEFSFEVSVCTMLLRHQVTTLRLTIGQEVLLMFDPETRQSKRPQLSHLLFNSVGTPSTCATLVVTSWPFNGEPSVTGFSCKALSNRKAFPSATETLESKQADCHTSTR